MITMFILTIEEQVNMMERQLDKFDNLLMKMQYMNAFFDKDPMFTQEARDTVRGNISKALV